MLTTSSVFLMIRRRAEFPVVSVLLVVLVASGLITPGDTQRYGSRDLYGRQWDVLFEPLAKAADQVRYPQDSMWKRVQKRLSISEPFPCKETDGKLRWRSTTRPDSVHKLLPGDIDVIGAMGDSLTAGNGAREFNPVGVTIQDRGVTITGGGLASWREVITLPNILKVFNPNLRGFASGLGDAGSTNAQLNVAVPAALDDDALKQAKAFVSGMLNDPNINFTSDWKVFSMFIGHNDICSYQCYNEKKHSPEAHKLNLQKALDYLYDRVPRLFVNMMSIIDTSIAARLRRPGFCNIMNRILCSCLFQRGNLETGISEMTKVVRKYQGVERELAFSERYTGRKDFTVEWQPFFQFMNLPIFYDKREVSMIDTISSNPLWSPDCFHFNQKGLAIWSVMLWNNMMQPVGNKSTTFKVLTHKDIKCPTLETPYLFTKENSDRYL